MGIIYKATNKINGKIYIGQTTVSLNKRIGKHYVSSKYHNHKFANALKYYKREDWNWEILVEAPTSSLPDLEKQFISQYNSYNFGYNSTIGGETSPMHDLDIRHKAANSKIGKKRKPFSEEHRRKISKSMAGKSKSKETKIKMSTSQSGKKLSDEHKRKLSDASKGNKNCLGKKLSKEHLNALMSCHIRTYKITKPDGSIEIVKNLKQYCRENNLNNSHMFQVVNGKEKHHKNYRAELYEQD